jgi:hypothetical protein
VSHMRSTLLLLRPVEGHSNHLSRRNILTLDCLDEKERMMPTHQELPSNLTVLRTLHQRFLFFQRGDITPVVSWIICASASYGWSVFLDY